MKTRRKESRHESGPPSARLICRIQFRRRARPWIYADFDGFLGALLSVLAPPPAQGLSFRVRYAGGYSRAVTGPSQREAQRSSNQEEVDLHSISELPLNDALLSLCRLQGTGEQSSDRDQRFDISGR